MPLNLPNDSEEAPGFAEQRKQILRTHKSLELGCLWGQGGGAGNGWGGGRHRMEIPNCIGDSQIVASQLRLHRDAEKGTHSQMGRDALESTRNKAAEKPCVCSTHPCFAPLVS